MTVEIPLFRHSQNRAAAGCLSMMAASGRHREGGVAASLTDTGAEAKHAYSKHSEKAGAVPVRPFKILCSRADFRAR